MLIRFTFILLFFCLPSFLLASEIVCKPIPAELAEVNYFSTDDVGVITVEVMVPSKYDSLEFLSFKMKVEPYNNEHGQLSLDVNLEAIHTGESVAADFELSNYKSSSIYLKAIYHGVCVSHLDIEIKPKELTP